MKMILWGLWFVSYQRTTTTTTPELKPGKAAESFGSVGRIAATTLIKSDPEHEISNWIAAFSARAKLCLIQALFLVKENGVQSQCASIKGAEWTSTGCIAKDIVNRE